MTPDGWCSACRRRGGKPPRRRNVRSSSADARCHRQGCERARGKHRNGLCYSCYLEKMYGVCTGCDKSAAQSKAGLCRTCERNGPGKRQRVGRVINSTHERWCGNCHSVKPLADFYPNASKSSGIANRCKDCVRREVRARSRRKRAAVWEQLQRTCVQAQLGVCAKCWRDLQGRWHIDHVIPASWGGADEVSNYQILCPECNLRKSNRECVDYRVPA